MHVFVCVVVVFGVLSHRFHVFKVNTSIHQKLDKRNTTSLPALSRIESNPPTTPPTLPTPPTPPTLPTLRVLRIFHNLCNSHTLHTLIAMTTTTRSMRSARGLDAPPSTGTRRWSKRTGARVKRFQTPCSPLHAMEANQTTWRIR